MEKVEVWILPKCNFCNNDAHFDFKTKQGPWAFGCDEHYKFWRQYERLGTGKGQELILKKRVDKSDKTLV